MMGSASGAESGIARGKENSGSDGGRGRERCGSSAGKIQQGGWKMWDGIARIGGAGKMETKVEEKGEVIRGGGRGGDTAIWRRRRWRQGCV